jgi:hypothetical protein
MYPVGRWARAEAAASHLSYYGGTRPLVLHLIDLILGSTYQILI